MLGVDRQHQPVEEAPPLGSGTEKQPVHLRHQPDDAQMIGEGRGRADRLAVDPAAPRGLRALGRRLDPGAERGSAERALDLGRDRPGAVALARCHFLERGAAQAAAGREKRDRLQEIGLARAVRAQQHDGSITDLELGAAIGAEILEPQPQDPRAARGA